MVRQWALASLLIAFTLLGVSNIALTAPGEAMQPKTMQGEVMQPKTMQGEVMQPKAMQGEVMQPKAMQGEVMQPKTMQGGVMQPKTMQGGVMQPKTMQGGVMQPKTMQGEVMQSKAMQGEATQPKTMQGEVMQSKAMQGEVMQPKTMQGEATQPKTMQGEATQPKTMQGEVMQSKAMQGEALDKEAVATNVSDVLPQPALVRYAGHDVLSATPASDAELQALLSLLKKEHVDVWKEAYQLNDSIHFRVAPEQLASMESYLKDSGLKYEHLIHNIQEIIDTQRASVRSTQFGWDNYYRIDSINAWLASLAAQHPDVATLVDGGRSYEGRVIQGIRIAHRAGLPVIFLEGGIHAREWISPAATTYILHQLLDSAEPAVQRVARSFEWHIFPSVNPDGYEYSHTTDRLWRKTRSRTTINCFGADPNRNWETGWGVTGVSWQPCSDVYPGVKAASELETRTRMNYMEPLMDRMKAFIALHSYGQFVLFPWGFTHSKTANHAEMLEVGKLAAGALYARFGHPFRVGNLADVLYEAGGSSMDWAHRNGARFSYTIELRDSGQFGFLLPPNQITAAAQETTDAVILMTNEVLRRIASTG